MDAHLYKQELNQRLYKHRLSYILLIYWHSQ